MRLSITLSKKTYGGFSTNLLKTTCLLVAEKFGKEHSDVLKAIDALACKMTENQCKGYFADSSIEIQQPNGGIRHSRVVVMNRDGFTLLVMGFTGQKNNIRSLSQVAGYKTNTPSW